MVKIQKSRSSRVKLPFFQAPIMLPKTLRSRWASDGHCGSVAAPPHDQIQYSHFEAQVGERWTLREHRRKPRRTFISAPVEAKVQAGERRTLREHRRQPPHTLSSDEVAIKIWVRDVHCLSTAASPPACSAPIRLPLRHRWASETHSGSTAAIRFIPSSPMLSQQAMPKFRYLDFENNELNDVWYNLERVAPALS